MKEQRYKRDIKRDLRIAKKNNIPLFILMSPNLTHEEMEQMDRYFIGANIFKKVYAEVTLDGIKDFDEIQADVERQAGEFLREYIEEEEKIDITRDARELVEKKEPGDIFVIIANRSYLRRMQG